MIWNNDLTSDTIYKGESAIYITGGTMQGRIIGYNRFVHEVGFALKSEGIGHNVTLKDNVSFVREPKITIFKGDVNGLKVTGNRFYNFQQGAF